MPARVIEICDALATYIAVQTYSQTFTTLRVNPAHQRLESTNDPYLYIYPGPEGPSSATRNKWLHTYSAILHLINFVETVTQAEIDESFELMEEIIDSIKETKISGRHLLEFSTEDNPEDPYVEGNLINLNTAQTVRRAIYQEMR